MKMEEKILSSRMDVKEVFQDEKHERNPRDNDDSRHFFLLLPGEAFKCHSRVREEIFENVSEKFRQRK